MFNLPDWKGTLQEALTNYVKTPLEQSTTNFTKFAESKANDLQANLESKFTEFKAHQEKFQRTVIAIAFAGFLVITITLTFKEKND